MDGKDEIIFSPIKFNWTIKNIGYDSGLFLESFFMYKSIGLLNNLDKIFLPATRFLRGSEEALAVKEGINSKCNKNTWRNTNCFSPSILLCCIKSNKELGMSYFFIGIIFKTFCIR